MHMFKMPHAFDDRPLINMAPLIDIVFLTLIFFMTLSVFYQLESELSIAVPEAQQAEETQQTPGEVVINITEEGTIIVNQKEMTREDLGRMLKRIAHLFPNQAVIVRADKKTYHEEVIGVLDKCAEARIWNVAFAVMDEE